MFGGVKADGTPFTAADCPGGTPGYSSLQRSSTGQLAITPLPAIGAAKATGPVATGLTSQPQTSSGGGQDGIRAGGTILRGTPVLHPAPLYPQAARDKGIEGVVVLLGVIEVDGTLRSLKVISTSDSLLNDSALDAVRQWVYTPTQLNGMPVESMTSITVNFSISR
jgi:TonB family protein